MSLREDPYTVLAVLAHRLEQVEARLSALEALRATDVKRRLVCSLAEELHLPCSLIKSGPTPDRRRLAAALRDRGWTYQAIAHALACSERTIERYFAPRKNDNQRKNDEPETGAGV